MHLSLDLPPIMMHASTGCARIISSVSMLIKLRRNMLVGAEKVSATLMVGKSIANPPANCTPLLVASMSCGVLPWPLMQVSSSGLYSVLQMPYKD